MTHVPHDLFLKGLEAAKKENWQEAQSHLEKAIELDPKFSDAYEVLGVVCGKQGRLDDAIQLLKKLIATHPDHIMAHANLSRFYQQKGMIFEAEEEQAEARRLSWKQELKSSPSSEAGSAVELEGEDEAKQAQINEKIERYKKVIEFDPKDILGYFTLGSALFEAKRFREAADILSQGLLVNPEHSPSYVVLGMSYEALGEVLQAKMTYDTGIPIASQRGDIMPLRKMEARLRKLRQG